MNLTLVTAFYDLNKYEKRKETKSKENYFKWAELLFELGINIVFITSKDNINRIYERRKHYNLLDKTLIISREFDKLKFYSLRDEIEQYKRENPIKNGTATRDSSNYYILMWNKFFFMEEIIKLNPFGDEYYGWIDFGIYHVVEKNMPNNLIELLTPDTKKIKLLELQNVFKKEMTDLHSFTSVTRWKVAGGLWTGHKDNCEKFIKYFKEQLFILLSERIFAQDETITSIVKYYHQDLFDVYYGNYYHIFCNYKKIVVPNVEIFKNIKQNRVVGDHKYAFNIASRLFTDGYKNMNTKQKYRIYDELLINSFYIDKELPRKYATLLLDDIKKDKNLAAEVAMDIKRQYNNFTFINDGTDKKNDLIKIIKAHGIQVNL